jgi:CPA1 family monovalent cation:H+ antiporter
MVLVLPQTTPNGQPFSLRDLFVVLVCLTTLISLTVQGLSLPWLVRRVKLAGSPDLTQQEQLVRQELAQTALDQLNLYVHSSAAEGWLVANLTRQYQRWHSQTDGSEPPTPAELTVPSGTVSLLTHETDLTLIKLRQSIVAAKSRALRSLRERNLIADEVLARFQLELDLEAEWLRSSLYTA